MRTVRHPKVYYLSWLPRESRPWNGLMATEDRPLPWGRTVGLLTACVVTLVGTFSRLEPFVVLQRAAIAAVLVGTALTLAITLVRAVVAAERNN